MAEETAKIPAKEERPPDFDFDADEAGSESDSDEVFFKSMFNPNGFSLMMETRRLKYPSKC